MKGLTIFIMVLMTLVAALTAKTFDPAVGIIIAIEAGCWAIADTVGDKK